MSDYFNRLESLAKEALTLYRLHIYVLEFSANIEKGKQDRLKELHALKLEQTEAASHNPASFL